MHHFLINDRRVFDASEWLAAICSHVPNRGKHPADILIVDGDDQAIRVLSDIDVLAGGGSRVHRCVPWRLFSDVLAHGQGALRPVAPDGRSDACRIEVIVHQIGPGCLFQLSGAESARITAGADRDGNGTMRRTVDRNSPRGIDIDAIQGIIGPEVHPRRCDGTGAVARHGRQDETPCDQDDDAIFYLQW